jgi:DNA processing protein
MEEILSWFFLKSVPGIGNHLFKRLIDHFGSPELILAASDSDLAAVDGISATLIRRIKNHQLPDEVKQDIRLVKQKKIRIVTMNDPDYPQLLLHIPDPPPFLYLQGQLDHTSKTIAMVGSRMASSYGRSIARRLSAELAAYGLTVVSGMARGIDTAAHVGAIEGGGKTVAVLGSGLERIYPAQNYLLSRNIINNGAVISEFPLHTEPEPHHFPIRNRIISGMSIGTIVVEAAKKSGSLITARLAAEQNREVFAVPGSIKSYKSMGAHTLIKQGAKLVENVQDVLEEISNLIDINRNSNTIKSLSKKEPNPLTPEENEVYKCLEHYPVHIDKLGRKTSIKAGKLASILLGLELKGRVEQLPGKFFTKVDEATN